MSTPRQRFRFTFKRIDKDSTGFYHPRWDKAVTVTAYGASQAEAAEKIRASSPPLRRGWHWSLLLVTAEEVDPPARDVGRCTEVLEVQILSHTTAAVTGVSEYERTPCSLDHGHSGAHLNDDTGTTWSDLDDTVRVPRDALTQLLNGAVTAIAQAASEADINSRLGDVIDTFGNVVRPLLGQAERVTGE